MGAGTGVPAGPGHMGGGPMSVEFAIALFVITMGSCYACYLSGQNVVLNRFADFVRREKEKQNRWAEFYEDFEG